LIGFNPLMSGAVTDSKKLKKDIESDEEAGFNPLMSGAVTDSSESSSLMNKLQK